MFAPPTTWPINSGDDFALEVCDANWSYSGYLIRVEETRVRIGHELDRLRHGGPDAALWVTTCCVSRLGYAGWTGEWTFVIEKADGGPIASGDEVAIRTTDGFYFRAEPNDGALMYCDKTDAFQDDTTFVAEFSEIIPGLGFRPDVVRCQDCATVSGTVRDAATGQPIAGASVQASGVLEDHPFDALTTADGTYVLTDPEGRTCIPAGSIVVQASADRHQTRRVNPVPVPVGGNVVVDVSLPCTEVSGRVVDGQGQPILGVVVVLTGSDGTPYLATTDPLDGTFTVACVVHGAAKAWTPDIANVVDFQVPPEGTTVELTVQQTCGDIVGDIVDAVSGQPLAGVTVTVVNSSGRTTTDAAGNFTIPCVRPSGQAAVLATLAGYQPALVAVNVPPAGPSTPVHIRLQPIVGQQVSEIQFVLTWSDEPDDLDSHMSGPDDAGGRFHILFNNRTPVPFADLDIDDTSEFGPERVTIRRGANGSFVADEYRYWVHNYSRTTFTGSDAVVTVLVNGAQVGRYSVADAAGNPNDGLWRVADIRVDANGNLQIQERQILEAGDENTIY